MKRFATTAAMLLSALLSALSCLNTDDIEAQIEELDQRISRLEEAAGKINSNSIALRTFMKENVVIVGLTDNGNEYILELSDGKKVTVTDGMNMPAIVPLIGITEKGEWIMSTDNGATFSPVTGASNAFSETGQTPLVKVDKDGFWLVSTDGGEKYSHIPGENGKPMSAVDGMLTGNMSKFFKEVKVEGDRFTIELKTGEVMVIPIVETFYLKAKDYSDKDVIFLNQTIEYKVEMEGVKDAFFQVPEGWSAVLTEQALQVTGPSDGKAGEYDINLVITSPDGYIKHITFVFTLNPKSYEPENCQLYKDFLAKNENNLLLDFSYAGYMYGEIAPPEASAWGYTVYDVTKYGAVANDGKSDRAAFLACVEAATGQKFVSGKTTLTLNHKEKSNAIIYFPEGEFILHTSADDHVFTDNKTYSQTILIRTSNIILRGAGRDKTTLIMQDPNLPTDENVLYSSPVMIDFKHNSGTGGKARRAVTGNTAKGTFSVEVESTDGFSVDGWACLTLKNNDPACIAKELEAGSPTATELAGMTDIVNNGVRVYEYHKIKKIEGKVITFYEPIMHDIDLQYTNFSTTKDSSDQPQFWNWSLHDYPHYENVGVEDLTFKGYAKPDFKHHGSWQDDGAYKPLQMTRLVNSWIRRVRFTSVSEAASITTSANVSVYDIEFDGNRGHSSIRSQQSTRVFIGATIDKSSGPLVDGGGHVEGTGQYHAVGVSKPSMGAVLWRNRWGSDSCFESHATQPRATLIDCCKGGWIPSRQGGDENQLPNHLDDLTIWNFEATNTNGIWTWWNHESKWHKYLPPTIVGFHGVSVTFDQTQVKTDFSNGVPVYPESLYEAQLKERLGAVPAWLNNLK